MQNVATGVSCLLLLLLLLLVLLVRLPDSTTGYR
jgi:hypothetical protein